ncbi:cytochrome PufQ [Tropicibacter sp. S64]|uniref:cytochrome PufQ n=1 Tax=Tropicibacter sp. S64 TaxID=3415122 RepID=UPI003C7DD113
MTDATSIPQRAHRTGRRRTTEFYVYFTAIFLIALPGCMLGWMRDVGRRQSLNVQGPLARAWVEAESTTPLIFSV